MLVISVTVGIYLRFLYVQFDAKRRNKENQIGIYILDAPKTRLLEYGYDTAGYGNIKIEFKKDMTFLINKKVPFLFDSIGLWNSGGVDIDEWNYLYYRSWSYSKYQENIGDQFSHCCDSDSTFYINSATPQNGRQSVREIYFKKLRIQESLASDSAAIEEKQRHAPTKN